MNKKSKGGNKRLRVDEEDIVPKINYSEQLRMVNETECIEELIELSRCPDENVRLKAVQQMCPCRVRTDQPDFWQRLFELAEDESVKVRYQVLHNMCDGSPEGYEDKVA